ncbi:MAG: hypothetical protein IKB60_04180 [Clostridia bacterium]|nr:hypothetical protein [Clostridia bacterium]
MKRNTWIYNAVILPIIILTFLLILMCAFDLNPFLRIMAERDYEKNKVIFEEFVLNYKDEEIVVTKENYDKSSRTLEILFEKMDYEFIRVSKDYVFFCKGYDGMSGIGVMHLTNENYMVSPKEKVVKKLDEYWVIFSEHYL